MGEESGERVGRLFSVFGAPIVQTTPAQAELAKIWTNILRYTEFALPNLLMMDCERHDANVFEVIDLINRDYPRGGIASPGLTAGSCLRKDFVFSEERSNAPGMLLAVSRVNESVPLFLIEGIRTRGSGRWPTRRSRCSGWPSSATPTTSATRWPTSSCACSSASWPTSPSTTPTCSSRRRASRRRSSTPTSWWSRPTTRTTASPEALRAIMDSGRGDCLVVDPWNAFGHGQVFAFATEVAVLARS